MVEEHTQPAKMGLRGVVLKHPKEELGSTFVERDGGPAVTKKRPWEILCVTIIFNWQLF